MLLKEIFFVVTVGQGGAAGTGNNAVIRASKHISSARGGNGGNSGNNAGRRWTKICQDDL
jgi:hypothetical protein